MVWAPVVVGLVLLGFGRRLYWLFVGAIGFGAGLAVASRVTGREPDLTAVLVALMAGVIGAVLALFLTRVAVALAGFAAGGWLAVGLWRVVTPPPHAAFPWLPALVGGVLGAVLSATLFKWVLIAISSLAGAALVAQYLPIDRSAQGAVLVILALLGIVAQAGLLKRAPPPPPSNVP
jgi:uncharacterized protein DUF4203